MRNFGLLIILALLGWALMTLVLVNAWRNDPESRRPRPGASRARMRGYPHPADIPGLRIYCDCGREWHGKRGKDGKVSWSPVGGPVR
jgi:hypothetical protein